MWRGFEAEIFLFGDSLTLVDVQSLGGKVRIILYIFRLHIELSDIDNASCNFEV